jgi:alpha-L-rhamnosidase
MASKKEETIIASDPSPLLRKEFAVPDGMIRAMLYVTALGEYEIYLNGACVGDQYLSPEWTDYSFRVQYQTYDVTPKLVKGNNAIGAMLGDGWCLGLLGPGDTIRQRFWADARRLLLKLVVETQDGQEIEVLSDGEWKVWEEGPIRSADHFMGETYDCTYELPGWNQIDFDDSAWTEVAVDDGIRASLVAQKNEPIKIYDTLIPIEVTSPSEGITIFDLGQNMVGWCEILLDGEAGTEITLRHGEMLEEDGTLYVANLRIARATDTYILDGKGERWFHPHFTFHGFRYVEVTGLQSEPNLGTLRGLAFCSSSPPAGQFECSNPMLNQLWSNILWTQRNNMASVPTDCPQRNERMGWMGDAQVFAQTAIYNLNIAAFFAKFVTDMRDAQGPDGQFTDFAPHPFPGPIKYAMMFAPGWADCGVIIPWRLYVAYGDTRVLSDHYEAMKRYVDLIREENPDFIWRVCQSNYGDWLNGNTIKAAGYPSFGGEVPRPVYSTYFFFLSATLLSKIAGILGKADECAEYAEVAQHVQEAFLQTYVEPDGTIQGYTQAGCAMALGFGILPEALQGPATEFMVEAIHGYDDRISTGFISTIHMMLELSRRGYNELAYQLAESKQFPSWGYTIEQGATTVWERWDGYVKGRGFQDPGMNSFDHYSIGAVGEWMYRVILGINFDESKPAMQHVILAPKPGGTLTWAKGHYYSIRGRISSSWERDETSTSYHFEIPPNTTATVHFERSARSRVCENGELVHDHPGVHVVAEEENQVILEVRAGTWTFSVEIP